MNNRVLFVDDDSHILASYQRQLRKQFNVDTALGGSQGLTQVANRGPYAVVVSDLRMPGMDGVEFLSRVREMAPTSVRMLLTGYADLQSAIDAVNKGNIFRLLTKPCPPDILMKALWDGVKQYRLIRVEQELLRGTLRGSIKMLTEVLGVVNPEAFGRAQRITRLVKKIGAEMKAADDWRLEIAAMLSQVGCITVPKNVLQKIHRGQELTKEEASLFGRHPSVASGLISCIPRMEKVSKIITYQQKHFSGAGLPEDSVKGEDIPLGSRILKVALDFDTLHASGIRKGQSVARLKLKVGRYDPAVLAALERVIAAEDASYQLKAVSIKDLKEDMILAEDIRTRGGALLLSRGIQMSQPLLDRLGDLIGGSRIRESIQVFVPLV